MKRFLRNANLLICCLLLLAGGLSAQQTTGKIMGSILLEDGSNVPGVLVEATSPRLVGKATAVSDENGNYKLLNLTPGVYTLTFTLQGLQTVIQKNVTLVAEQTITLNVPMKMGEVTENITVQAVAAQIDVRSTAQGQTLTKETFQSLPKGRNFDSLMTTIPGVQNEPLLGGTSVDGATGLENVYYVDGVDTTNIVNGNAGQMVNFDFVEEVKISSSGYAAEFGGSLGGVINVITRSGGNEFHGDILGYYTGAPLRADYSDTLDFDYRDSTNGTARYYTYEEYYGKDKDSLIEGGFNLGGYIVKDKLWFFGSFMPSIYRNTRTTTHYSGITKDWKYSQDFWNYQFKLTGQLASNLRVSASMVSGSSRFQGATGTGNILPRAASSDNPTISYNDIGYSQPNYSANATLDWNIGNLQVNLRGGYFFQNINNSLVYPEDTQYIFQKEAPGGYTNTGNQHLDIPAEYKRNLGFVQGISPIATKKQIDEKMSINADLAYYTSFFGDHALKAGVQFTHQGEDYDAGSQFPIVRLAWDRDLIAYGDNYGRGTYGYYAVRGSEVTGPNGSVYKAYANRWAVYLQDSWTIGDRFTLNIGIRSEAEYIPAGYTDDSQWANTRPVEWGFGDKLAPRLGFIWDVKGDASTKISGSFGIFYDVMKLSMAVGSYGGFKWKSAYYPLNTYEWDKIGQEGWDYGEPLAIFDFRPTAFAVTDGDMHAMSQRELSLGFEQRVTDDIAFKARLVNKSLLWAIEDIGVMTDAGELYYITNPGSDYIKNIWAQSKADGSIVANARDIPKAKREYWGLNLSLEKRFSNNWMGGLAYTWSRQTGNYSGLASGDEMGRISPNVARFYDVWWVAYDKALNPIDGPLNADRTHVIKAYGSYAFDFGLTAGFVVNAMSGVPISTMYNMDYQGYMPFGRGDLGRTPFMTVVDFSLNYNIRLGKSSLNLSVNVDNLLNTHTAMSTYQYYNIDTFPVTDTEIANNSWDISDYEVQLDPLFQKEQWFYGDGTRGNPRRVRVGLKFSF